MRVLQLIDSLRPGGAEQMAVLYANALAKRIDGSFLCCTRIEGLLKKRISPEVGYIFLEKKRTIDLNALWKLRRYIKKNEINIIQAHSSSWFLALLVKISSPKVKLVWHDHYGKELGKRKIGALKFASNFFSGIISVNVRLKEWAEKNLHCGRVAYFKNFLPSDQEVETISKVHRLKGNVDSFKVICVANLRPQKDHFNLLDAFRRLHQYENVSLHIIGKADGDKYSEEIKSYILEKGLQGIIFLYGEKEEITGFLQQADLGVLSSISEGLPVALLEYGRAGLPVVSTNVGECAEVIGRYGVIVPPKDPNAFADAICLYLEDQDRRRHDGLGFQGKVSREFSEEVVIWKVISFLENCEVG